MNQVYFVTGEVHGSIVVATSVDEAIARFKLVYSNELVIKVKLHVVGILP